MNKRIKICFITQCSLPIPTVKGGAVETLVEYLLVENEIYEKYDFTVLSIDDLRARGISKKFKYTDFIYIKKRNDTLNKINTFIYKVLKRFGIYIPFTLEFRDMLKTIKLIKDDYNLFIYESGPTTQLPLLNKYIEKSKLISHLHWNGLSNEKKDKSFDYLIPVSKYIGNQWEKSSSDKNGNINILKNCAKIDYFKKKLTENEKIQLKKSLNIPLDNFIVIFTGRIVKEKGVFQLLKAIEDLSHDKISLLIIGSANFGEKTNTKYEKEIKVQIESMKKNVVFTGFIPQQKLYKYYNISDVAVMPSLFQDPAPLVCIETQATGTPLIATRVGGIPEYVGDSTILINNDENLIKNITNKIDYLIDNKDILEIMSKDGIENARKYNTENYFKDFNNIIDKIIKNNSR